MLSKIEDVLNERVRPQLALHQGNVQVLSYENQILKIKMLGQCSGCPSAAITTEELIRKEVMDAIPEVKDVILVTSVSPDLILAAKEILCKNR